MKKIFALVIILVFALSLSACGNTDKAFIDKNDPASYVGYWKSAHMSFRFLDNGTGFYGWENVKWEFKYDIKDNAVSILTESRTENDYAVLELNDDGSALILIQNGLEYYTRGETEFIKTKTYSKSHSWY